MGLEFSKDTLDISSRGLGTGEADMWVEKVWEIDCKLQIIDNWKFFGQVYNDAMQKSTAYMETFVAGQQGYPVMNGSKQPKI